MFGRTYDQLLGLMPAAEERPGNISGTVILHYTLHVELGKFRYTDCVFADRIYYSEELGYLRTYFGFAIMVLNGQMFPRHKVVAILFSNPETKPQ